MCVLQAAAYRLKFMSRTHKVGGDKITFLATAKTLISFISNYAF